MNTRVNFWQLLLLSLLVAGASATGAWADWQAVADSQVSEEIEDDPAWEQYAFELDYADGSGELSFAELARADQPFVLFFWLTDCPVCHLQLPYVALLQNEIEEHGLDLRIVSINLDFDERACLELWEEKELGFDLLIDRRARRTDDAYRLSELGTPISYVFDAGGGFVDYLSGFRSEYAQAVLRLLDIDSPDAPGPR